MTLRPSSAAVDLAYGRFVNPELLCDGSPGCASGNCGADQFDLRSSQLVRPVSFAARVAILALRVLHVVAPSSWRKVIRVHAFSVVAEMQDVQTIRDVSLDHLVGNAMRSDGFMLDSDRAVPGFKKSASPVPARVGFIDFCPEAGRQVLLEPSGLRRCFTSVAAKIPYAASGWRTIERSFALITNSHRAVFAHGASYLFYGVYH
jgi:hypothetical protein